MNLKHSFAKWWPFCLGFTVLNGRDLPQYHRCIQWLQLSKLLQPCLHISQSVRVDRIWLAYTFVRCGFYSSVLCPSWHVMGLSSAWSVMVHWCKICGFHFQNQEKIIPIFMLAIEACEFYRITPSFLFGHWRYEVNLNTLTCWNISIQTTNKNYARQFCMLLTIVIDKTIDHAPTTWIHPTNVGFRVLGILACRNTCSTLVIYLIGIEL